MKRNEQLERKLEKEKKIKQEINRIKKNYKDLEKEKVKTLDGLLNDAGFLKVSLEEVREVLLKEGLTEVFEQGEQRFNREKPEVKIYKDFLKLYANVMKQLIDLMPVDVKGMELDELAMFQERYRRLKK